MCVEEEIAMTHSGRGKWKRARGKLFFSQKVKTCTAAAGRSPPPINIAITWLRSFACL